MELIYNTPLFQRLGDYCKRGDERGVKQRMATKKQCFLETARQMHITYELIALAAAHKNSCSSPSQPISQHGKQSWT